MLGFVAAIVNQSRGPAMTPCGQIIINADDFGISPGVNRAIVELHRAGAVTSTTLLANLPGSAEAIELAHANPSLAVGLHLNLTEGRPLSPPERVRSLVGPDGRFHRGREFFRRALTGRLDADEVARELAAQFARGREASLRFSHVDGHLQIHSTPVVLRALPALMAEHGVRAMRPATPGAWVPLQLRSLALDERRWAPLLRAPAPLLRWAQRRGELACFATWQEAVARPDYMLDLQWTRLRWWRTRHDNPLARLSHSLAGIPRGGRVEILAHPGGAGDDSWRLWQSEFLGDPAFAAALRDAGLEAISYRALVETPVMASDSAHRSLTLSG